MVDVESGMQVIKRGCDELLVDAELIDAPEERPAVADQGGI